MTKNGKTFLDFKEMKELLAIVKEIPAEQILIRLLSNGLAPRDIVRIRVKHFKFGKGMLRFKGKDAIKREIDIDLPTLAHVQKYIKDEKMSKAQYLFGWSEKYIHDIVKRNGDIASLEVTPTLLRNTWIYLAVRSGKDVEYIHRQLGNTNLEYTKEVVEQYRELDKDYQPKVMVFVPVCESKKPVIEATLKGVAALDYKNYTVKVGVNNSSGDFVSWLVGVGKKYGAKVVDLGEIDAMEEVEIEGKTYIAEIEKGKVISFARKARNMGQEIFLKTDAEYVVMCDADCPPKTNAIKTFLKQFKSPRYKKVGIVSGVVFIRASGKIGKDGKELHIPAIYFDPGKRENWSECYNFFFKQYSQIEVIDVDGVGMGCTMIAREVAEQVSFDFPKDMTRFMGEDFYYCHQTQELGFKVLCVGEVIADHLEEEDFAVEGTHTDEQESEEEATAPQVETISEFTSASYNEEYFEDGLRNKVSGYIGYYNHPLFKAMARELKYYFKPKKVLDTGAAKGFLVAELSELDIDAHGIDLSEYAVKNAPIEIADRMTQGSATEMPYEAKEFDLVVSFDMMEHLNEEQYRAAIREMARVSKKNIMFSITTDDNVIDKTHISVMPIQEWIKIIDQEIGQEFFRHKSNFLDQSILWFTPSMCLIYSRRKKK